MTKVLHLSASPRGPRSESLAIATTFLDTLRDLSPSTPIETYDLWDGTLPPFGPDAASAKMTVFAGEQPQGAAADAWNAAVATFRRFDAADRYVFSVPMWNAGVPYILKQFIDVISQPGLVFGFDPVQGYQGLLRGKRAAVIYTSAVYGPGRGPAFGADFQAPYLEDWLRWAGVDDIHSIHFRPNLATADADAGRHQAHTQAREMAKKFMS
ncbi:FMN-dependent NADH-azoreductase [Paractinoplanes brasiliensis]|uniref:FMN dependent NADH:quinone oxidoreductase n=1 Tax=Paractinoplanes brasiliensis TaxID=52695 RepID=A0A4R6JAH0_9ACTN|nr:NAD(P)H-dependent oxidoreductase [Actinoplanes brasiliensis]TDO32674.1 FMN-dependent NADH-azoreductase [Actinoplanes brasiliensis]GID32806.1 FMN-dependent NADH-azoreductase [Actinoplanes brasiliensis]